VAIVEVVVVVVVVVVGRGSMKSFGGKMRMTMRWRK